MLIADDPEFHLRRRAPAGPGTTSFATAAAPRVPVVTTVGTWRVHQGGPEPSHWRPGEPDPLGAGGTERGVATPCTVLAPVGARGPTAPP
jgi:hypothetical protein